MEKLYDSAGNVLDIAQDKSTAHSSISVEYGRIEGTSYYFVRVPKHTLDGKRIKPRVALTDADGKLGGRNVSALTFAKRENVLLTINAGLFYPSNGTPHGQTIVDGVSITNSLVPEDFSKEISTAECYPLCIDAEGMLSSPYAQGVDTATMLADGVRYAVTGWGQIVDAFALTDATKYDEWVHKDEKIPIQAIGQFQNGDYFVFTADGKRGSVTNETGMTDAKAAAFLVSKGVKYAYLLDGGGSTETVLGHRQVNPIYEGSAGRAIPTVIYFEVAEG